MSLYDTVLAINIANKNFNHNGVALQTKDLGRTLSAYVIFNGKLYHIDKLDKTNTRPNFDFDDLIHSNLTYFFEYDLYFNNGNLYGINKYDDECIKAKLFNYTGLMNISDISSMHYLIHFKNGNLVKIKPEQNTPLT